MKRLFILTFLLLPIFSFAGDIEISNPYLYEPIPTSKNTGMFMEIKNNGTKDVKVSAVSSSVSNVTEVHTHIDRDGMKQMVQVKDYTIKPQETKILKRGGDHIMLIGLKKPLKVGDSVDLKITFDNKEVIELKDVKVVERAK